MKPGSTTVVFTVTHPARAGRQKVASTPNMRIGHLAAGCAADFGYPPYGSVWTLQESWSLRILPADGEAAELVDGGVYELVETGAGV